MKNYFLGILTIDICVNLDTRHLTVMVLLNDFQILTYDT